MDERVGAQVPTHHLVPPSATNRGLEAVVLAKMGGLTLDPWQRNLMQDTLGFRDNGKFAAKEVGLIVPRQNGKSLSLVARILMGLFKLQEEKIIYTAHQLKTATEIHRATVDAIYRSKRLSALVTNVYQSNQERSIVLGGKGTNRTEQRVQFMTRGSGSGRGFAGDCVIFDEAYNLSPDVVADLLPTLSAKPNPQVWYVSSTGMPDSDALRQVHQRGLAGEKLLAFSEWAASDGCDLSDIENWYLTNPALGIRMDLETLELEWRALKDLPGGPERFARERLGMWASTDIDAAIPEGVWMNNIDGVNQIVGDIAIGFDVSPNQAHGAVYVAGQNANGLLTIERAHIDMGTQWIPEYIRGITERRKVRAVAFDGGSQASAIAPELTRLGVEAEATSLGVWGLLVGSSSMPRWSRR
ncbi:hypothetical protein [Tsukamurella soli]|uniref:hypothetical protein n=1 Tax=Tsukamurella soli TaxID=644556 RepID=UPI0036135F09